MDPGEDEPSREALESRVAELEQTVSKMLPDRRGVLKGLGAAAIGGAAVGGATGGASGQSAAGQVGTEASPEDVFAFDLDVQGALQRDLDAGGQAISNVGSVSTVEAIINDDLEIRTGGNIEFKTDPDGSIGTHNVRFIPGASADLNALVWGGNRGLVFDKLDDKYGGFPGVDILDNAGGNAVAVRPPDTGEAGVWWDRSDGSKEWAYKALSGQDSPDDERAFALQQRTLDMAAPVRNEPMAPDSGTTRGAVKFRDDFLGALRNEWTHSGTGSFSFQSNTESGSGGAIILETTATSGESSTIDFNGFAPFELSHAWRFRTVFRGSDTSSVSKEWGVYADSNNYVRFLFDDSISGNILAETASGGSVTQTDTGSVLGTGGEYICQIVFDPYASEIRFEVSNARADYPSIVFIDQNTATITTDIPSGFAEPRFSVTTNEAAAKRMNHDYVWLESERVASSVDP